MKDTAARGGVAVLLMFACACLGPTEPGVPQPPTGPGRHVLFVGNSHTYHNAVPAMLEALADSAGEVLLETRMVAFPDFGLAEHWADGRARTAIERGGYHHVVLQQGPSALASSRALLIEYVARYDSVIAATGAATALYAPWPSYQRQFDFPASAESYRIAADSVDALLLPVGTAWQAAWARDSAIPLYDADGLHGNVNAAYLAALVMYAQLYQKTPIGLPPRFRLRAGTTVAIPEGVAATLQEAAWAVTGGVAAGGARKATR